MSKGTAHRVIKNSLLGGLSFILSMMQAIVTVPVLLKFWGQQSYSTWLILMAGFSLLQSFDGGHTTYIGNQVNLLYHKDKKLLRPVLASSLVVAIILGLSQIIIASVLILSNNLTLLLGLDNSNLQEHDFSLGLIILLLMWTIFGSAGGILVRLMIPLGKFYESQWFNIFIRAFQFLVLLLIAFFHGTILMAAVSYAITQALFTIVLIFYIKKVDPELYPWWKGYSISLGFKNFYKSSILTFSTIGQQFSLNGTLIIISKLSGALYVPVFATIRTLTNTANTAASLLSQSLFPEITRFYALNEKRKMLETFKQFAFWTSLVTNSGIILIYPFSEKLFTIWTRNKLEFNFTLFFCLTLSISITACASLYYQFLNGINNLKALVIVTITKLVLLIGLIFLFKYYFGDTGYGIAIFCSEVISSALLPIFFTVRLLDINRSEYFNLLRTFLTPIFIGLGGTVIIILGLSLFYFYLLFIPLIIVQFYVYKTLDHKIALRQFFKKSKEL